MAEETILVNGEAMPLTGATVEDLLRDMSVDPSARGFAVAVNQAVVVRAMWRKTELRAGDQVEIVKPFAGG